MLVSESGHLAKLWYQEDLSTCSLILRYQYWLIRLLDCDIVLGLIVVSQGHLRTISTLESTIRVLIKVNLFHAIGLFGLSIAGDYNTEFHLIIDLLTRFPLLLHLLNECEHFVGSDDLIRHIYHDEGT